MGYVTYNKVPVTQVIHKKGLSAEGMFTNNLYYMDDYEGLEDILSNFKPKMLYVGFGMNDLKKSPSEFYEIYKKNIEKLRQLCPNTKIALISITPINSAEFEISKVDEFNVKIKQISQELGNDCFYINIHSLLEDSQGKLKDEYNSGDGIHIKPEAYDVILSYYKKYLIS